MARPGEGVDRRFQFRLDERDPAQRALYDTLISLPAGRRNAYIIERLLSGGGQPDKDLTDQIIRRIDADRIAAAIATRVTHAAAAAPGGHTDSIPDACFDTSIFAKNKEDFL